MKKNFFLFFFLSYLYAINYSVIYNSYKWKALLHYDNKFNIKDKNFYISKTPTLKKEFFATLNAFQQGKYQCKFPARKLFLEKELNITFPTSKCPKLKTYLDKVPIDKIYLVFSSENIKDPSSMMGHTFFKFEGKRKDGFIATHAISFYTMINTINPVKLIYENTIPGMNGYFVLRPYKEVLYNYLVNENRNVWEFKLKLNKFERKMIALHSWELKDIKQKYYFTSYNCANVIYDIISTAKPIKKYQLWLTPLELIKITNQEKLIQKANLYPSDEWFIKLLENELTFKEIYQLKKNVLNQNIKAFELNNTKKSFYKITLAKVYINYLKNNNLLTLKQALYNKKFKYSIDLSKYKNPLKTPPERQVTFSVVKENENFLKLSFLPASHTLNDNNREYFNESELKIGYISILFNKNKILLNNFSIYSMTNLIPYDILTNPFSYSFNISLDREYDKNLDKRLYFNCNAGLGYDINIANDINLYILGKIKIRTHNKIDLLYYPKFGILMYEIFNSKLNFHYKPVFIRNSLLYNELSLTQTFYLRNNRKIFFKVQKIDNKTEIETGFVWLF